MLQCIWVDILTPVEQSQNIHISPAENQSLPPFRVPADAENVLAPLPAQEQFRRLSPPLCGGNLLPPHSRQTGMYFLASGQERKASNFKAFKAADTQQTAHFENVAQKARK